MYICRVVCCILKMCLSKNFSVCVLMYICVSASFYALKKKKRSIDFHFLKKNCVCSTKMNFKKLLLRFALI